MVIWSADPSRDESVERRLSENKARGTLAVLLLRANRFVTQAQMSQLLWDTPPDSARSNIRSYVARVRKALDLADLGVSRLSSVKRCGPSDGGSYSLRVEPMELDADVFVRLVRRAGEEARAGAVARAAAMLRLALGLWRGDAGHADLAVADSLRAQLDALNQLRLVAQEDLLSLQLRLGEHRLLIPEIRGLLTEHQMREGLWAQLMRAHYRSGDIGGALNAYKEYWRVLDRNLGVQPGPMLQQLYRSILDRDDESV
ncbi:AfsR/SARP family transcriptional regulator [Micromonospora eburnea]|uniref:AfsR/SARP family transcriptional regulator n=1 Tax=Micromonospora eburnea TaxID=227316 RepID=UPI001428BB36|nr:AfsR/SARP family transcriptional regulator [Micromonospora eburnea]